MEIDIEDGDPPRTLIEEHLRRNRGVVQEAIAAIHVERRMMARRPAQGKRGSLALRHQSLARLRHGGARLHGGPCAGGDGSLRAECVITGLAVDVIGYPLLHASHWKSGGNDLAPRPPCGPFRPSRLEKCDETRIMHAQCGFLVEAVGCRDICELSLLQPTQNVFHARRPLERCHELSETQLPLREML